MAEQQTMSEFNTPLSEATDAFTHALDMLDKAKVEVDKTQTQMKFAMIESGQKVLKVGCRKYILEETEASQKIKVKKVKE